jgi:ribose 5-phosphate isomerase B
VLQALADAGHEVIPAGSIAELARSRQVRRAAVADGRADYGVVMCWTGTGTAIAANKVPGVRAALAWDPWIARGARLWNDANVLAMSLKRLAPDVAVEVLQAFLTTPEPTRRKRRTSPRSISPDATARHFHSSPAGDEVPAGLPGPWSSLGCGVGNEIDRGG